MPADKPQIHADGPQMPTDKPQIHADRPQILLSVVCLCESAANLRQSLAYQVLIAVRDVPWRYSSLVSRSRFCKSCASAICSASFPESRCKSATCSCGHSSTTLRELARRAADSVASAKICATDGIARHHDPQSRIIR